MSQSHRCGKFIGVGIKLKVRGPKKILTPHFSVAPPIQQLSVIPHHNDGTRSISIPSGLSRWLVIYQYRSEGGTGGQMSPVAGIGGAE